MTQPDRWSKRAPHVVVVDPRFEAYSELAAAAQEGRIELHVRSSGSEALRLAARLPVDAWLVAADDLDDMSGEDFVSLLRDLDGDGHPSRVAVVGSNGRTGSDPTAAGADALLEQPLALADLEALLAIPAANRAAALPRMAARRGLVAVPVGIGAAMVAVAVLMMG